MFDWLINIYTNHSEFFDQFNYQLNLVFGTALITFLITTTIIISYCKPSDKSFNKWFLKNKEIMEAVVGKKTVESCRMSSYLEHVLQPKFNDFLFFKTCTIVYENRRYTFSGMFNKWKYELS